MGRGILRQTITVLTAAMLLVQSITSLSAACQCGSLAPEPEASCCQAVAPDSDCCSQPRSCCPTGSCGCGDSGPLSKCGCGCSDNDERQPFTPAEKPERSQKTVELSFQASYLAADAVALVVDERLSVASSLHAPSASHSRQSLLCIWQT